MVQSVQQELSSGANGHVLTYPVSGACMTLMKIMKPGYPLACHTHIYYIIQRHLIIDLLF